MEVGAGRNLEVFRLNLHALIYLKFFYISIREWLILLHHIFLALKAAIWT